MAAHPPVFTASLEWHFLLSHVLRRIWTIFLAALLGFLGTVRYTCWLQVPVYTSSAVLAVSVTSNDAGAFANLTSSAAMAEQYGYVFEDPIMLQLAADHLGLDSFPGTLTASVTANVNLIEVTVEAGSPDLARDALLAVLDVHPAVSKSVFTNAAIAVVEAPQLAKEPSNACAPLCFWLVPVLAAAVQLLLLVLQSLFSGTIQHEAGYRHWIAHPLVGTVCHQTYSLLLYREDLRKLAAYLEHCHLKHGNYVFAFTAAASGEGCTTLVSDVAQILARWGYSVAVQGPNQNTDDLVLLDRPAGSVSDADLTLFVIRAGRLPAREILESLDALTQASDTPPVCILNGTYPTQAKRTAADRPPTDTRQKELLNRA